MGGGSLHGIVFILDCTVKKGELMLTQRCAYPSTNNVYDMQMQLYHKFLATILTNKLVILTILLGVHNNVFQYI